MTPDRESRPSRLRVAIDGWPAIEIEPTSGTIAVNDLRSTHQFAHRATPDAERRTESRIHIVVDPDRSSLCIDTGPVVAWIDHEPGSSTHSHVLAMSSDGVQMLDTEVRCCQLPAAGIPCRPSDYPQR